MISFHCVVQRQIESQLIVPHDRSDIQWQKTEVHFVSSFVSSLFDSDNVQQHLGYEP